MREYQIEHILGALLELRAIERFRKKVLSHIETHGWPYVVDALKRCRASEVIVPGWDTHLREGILREGMINLLRFEDIPFLDVDFLDAFSDLEAKNLADLRYQARTHSFELLREQISRGNTFFMDVESMKKDEFLPIIPEIIHARTKEIQQLSPKPDLYEVYSTYYGFQVLITGVNFQQTGIPVDIQESLLGILSDVGEVESLERKQLKFSPLAFRNCTPHLAILLWNMLRFANGGWKAKSTALKVLGELGDSRALDMIHTYIDYQSASQRRVRGSLFIDECNLCLGRIGNPRSFEYLRSMRTDSERIALGGLRHPSVEKLFQNILHISYRRSTMLTLIQALGKTRSRNWLSFYMSKKQREKAPSVLQALEHAERNVHPHFDFE